MSEPHAELLAALPPWSTDPLARLEHTLAAYSEQPPQGWVVVASSTPTPDGIACTGLTWGDLHQLACEVRDARAAVADRQEPPGGER